MVHTKRDTETGRGKGRTEVVHRQRSTHSYRAAGGQTPRTAARGKQMIKGYRETAAAALLLTQDTSNSHHQCYFRRETRPVSIGSLKQALSYFHLLRGKLFGRKPSSHLARVYLGTRTNVDQERFFCTLSSAGSKTTPNQRLNQQPLTEPGRFHRGR